MSIRQMRIVGFVVVAAAAVGLLTPTTLMAHHGWEWATDKEFEITGKVADVSLGNPHGRVTINVDGEEWLVQVGQPWRNQRAGLSNARLQQGTTITVHGHRSAREGEHVVKAERVVIDGENFDLYPDRES